MPHYMLLIHTPSAGLSPEEGRAELPKWLAYTEALLDAGVFVAGDALERAATATTVRLEDGERIVSDGPFADTKETLAGYYVVDVPDLDTALDWAVRAPSAARGPVEVRRVMVFDQQPDTAAATGSPAAA